MVISLICLMGIWAVHRREVQKRVLAETPVVVVEDDLPAGAREVTEMERPPLDVQLLTVNEYSRPGITLVQVNGIVIHYTANPGTSAQDNRNYFENLKRRIQQRRAVILSSGSTARSSSVFRAVNGHMLQMNEMPTRSRLNAVYRTRVESSRIKRMIRLSNLSPGSVFAIASMRRICCVIMILREKIVRNIL